MTLNKIFRVTDENQKKIDEYIHFKKAQKNISRPRGISQSLKKLADYFYPKKLEDITAKDLQNFFANKKEVKFPSRNTYGAHIIPFYRWIDDLSIRDRPERLKWFMYNSRKEERKRVDPDLKTKYFITREEYEKIIKYSKDVYGQRKALWETYYLIGTRPEELALRVEDEEIYYPKIDDVRVLKDGNVEFIVRKSKTQPRKVPFPEYPENLIRYLGNHPDRKNKDAPLFFSLKSEEQLTPMSEHGIYEFFKRMRKNLGLRDTLNMKSFRKTRATIYFNDRRYNDSDMSKIFGWTPETVAQRRVEYDLSDYDDLKKKIFSKPTIDKSYDTILKEKMTLEEKHMEEIKNLKEQVSHLLHGFDGCYYKDGKSTPIYETEEWQLQLKKIMDEHYGIG